ncbi:nucleoid occlusion factor SlmA [Pusillimonas sp.]|uniref:nucleoid occlusion factor SlmA n=1 Tax=Pusillimonas sp. TaxID=3040095 RepID=UPI0037CC3C43
MPKQPSAKQVAILATLSGMLESPGAIRITTAALAKCLNQSEAALYRHYAGKAAMFEGLITLTGDQLLEDLAHIAATEPQGKARLRKQVHALLLFVERHPGAARVLTGIALTGEDPSLQEQVNALLRSVADVLEQSARLESQQDKHEGGEAALTADVLLEWVLGRWLRYAQSGWQAKPTADLPRRLSLLGL